jgi:geranylgeranyl pyrophosphate synthase
VNTINLLKTARLFEASAQLGAIVSGVGKREKRAMARFGSSLGVAFQIADDLIDGEGYARIFGADKARRDCEALTLQAKAALAVFGARSNRLKELADHMAARRT